MKNKLFEWTKRYLPAEIVGTVTALSAATIVHNIYGNHILTAYAGSLGEAIGFYSTVLIQNIKNKNKQLELENKKLDFRIFRKIISLMLLEFGPAGIIDGLLLRPFFLFLFPILVENFTLGIFVGKIVGDITFYILVILSYELSNRKQNKNTQRI